MQLFKSRNVIADKTQGSGYATALLINVHTEAAEPWQFVGKVRFPVVKKLGTAFGIHNGVQHGERVFFFADSLTCNGVQHTVNAEHRRPSYGNVDIAGAFFYGKFHNINQCLRIVHDASLSLPALSNSKKLAPTSLRGLLKIRYTRPAAVR